MGDCRYKQSSIYCMGHGSQDLIDCHRPAHAQHAFVNYYGRAWEGLALVSRRGMLKAGLAGIAGLSLPELLRSRARAAETGRVTKSARSVILLWMAGGPSHI